MLARLGVEWIKRPLYRRLVHALTVVTDIDGDPPIRLNHGNFNLPRPRLDGILRRIGDHVCQCRMHGLISRRVEVP